VESGGAHNERKRAALPCYCITTMSDLLFVLVLLFFVLVVIGVVTTLGGFVRDVLRWLRRTL